MRYTQQIAYLDHMFGLKEPLSSQNPPNWKYSAEIYRELEWILQDCSDRIEPAKIREIKADMLEGDGDTICKHLLWVYENIRSWPHDRFLEVMVREHSIPHRASRNPKARMVDL